MNRLAYIIYTSGSTGVPKGVAVTHRNVVRLFESTQPEYRFDARDVWTLFHSAAFDFSVWELWGALLYGGRVVIVTHEESRNTEAFYELVAREGVTVLNQTPSAFRQFDGVDATKRADLALRLVIFGGEALDPSTMRAWFERHGDARPRVINMYGITETTVFVTWRPLSIADLQMPAVIGTPIPGWQIHLLDRHGNLVPEGVAGEIYVGGEGVALGYLHRPELNAQRFLPDRFAENGTLYRSGDLARRISATEIEYLGRIDQQVKVRGFRIELGEIEQRLLEHPSIRDAAVLPHDGEDGVELAAFLFGAPQIAAHELRARLTETLPEYMVPSRFVSVAERPLTSNGKLDHRALLELLAPSGAPAEQPATAIEETLLAIWSDVLGTPVRRDDSFFALGGHSLKAARLIGRVRRELAVDVSLADLFTAPSVAGLAQLLEGRVRASLAPIEPLPRAESYDLSHAQRRLWVIEQFEQAEGAYNVPAALMLEGALDVDALHAALHAVVERHESLRTHFIDGPRQVIGAPEFSWTVIDADEAAALRIAQTEALHKFDLARDPLLRVTLVRIAADKHLFVFVAHHIVCDARSLEIFVRDVADAYAKKPLAPLAIQYKDFAAWQAGDAFAAHRAWWHELLDGELPRIDLPADFPRPAVRTYRGATRSFRIAPARQQRIDALAKKHGLTPVLLALVDVLLFRLTGQRDLITGHPVTGRVHPDLDDQIGMYVNTLPLRMRLRGDAALDETIAEMSRLFAGAFDHQSYPFDRLIDELRVSRDTARSPLFDVLVVVHDAGETALALDGIRATPVPLDSGTSKFDLSFYFTQRGGELSCDVEYDTALFHRDSVERWWRAFERVLDAADDARLDAIDVVCVDELPPFAPQPIEDATLVSLFEQQVDATPSAIAIAPSTTYRALDKQANRIANWLLDQRLAKSGACVAVRLDRGADLIAAILGILKAGAAYVPLDPAYPDARAQFIIEDSGATTVLDESKLRLAASFSAARPGVATTPCDAAYVLYTSGSTGEPKGVVVEQRSVVNVVRALLLDAVSAPSDPLRVALIAPLIFDVSVHQLFAALFGGHEVHVISEEMKRDPAQLVRYFAEHAIDAADCTPTLFAMLLESGLASSARPPRHLILAGEALPRALVERFYANGRHRTTRMTNAYGPTEACVYATAYAIDPDRLPVGSIPIGTPLTNVEILILDDALQLTPRGCIGEICIGGAGLARGYLHRDALTAERFVAHPLRAGERLYRTGDYGRWNVDGQLEYLGRRDAQVKVRGHRLELGEVEAALRRHPQVRDAVAITIGDDVDRDLAGYVAAPPSLTPSAIRDFLAGVVPDFLIPSRIIVVDALPLTASGKVDRKALPPLDAAPAEEDALPRNELEQQIAALWETVLQRKDLGVRTDFFAAGGQSLKAVQLVARLRELTGRAIAFSDVFRHPTIEAQARLIKEMWRPLPSAVAVPLSAAAPADLYACSHAQRRMFFLDRVDATGRAYQMPGLFRVDGPLDERALREACRRVALRHESLRTTFTLVDGEPMQRVSPRADVRVSVIEAAIDVDDEDALRELIARDTARRFDLERGPLWRITLFRIAPETHLLLFNMHHLIADGRSIDVFAREIAGGDELPPLAIQYKDFAAWQNTLALDDSAAYWREKLAPPIAALELPADRPRPAARSFEGRVAHATFAATLIARLDAAAREQQTTLFAALVAAVKIVLQRWSGEEDIVTGSPVAGRERVELEEQIGLYVNTVVLRDRIRAGDSPAETLRSVGRTIAEALEHQSYPFDRLVSDLALPRDPARSPLFDVLIAMQESPAVDLRLGGAIVRELPLRGEASKFDLGFHFVPRADGAVLLDLEYATALFDAPRIEKLIADVVRAASAIGGDDFTPRLMEIWSEILDEPEVEVTDDFFELGGDSLRAMRLLARVERDLEVAISLGDFLLAPTIEGMIALAQRARRGAEAIPVTAQAEDYELTAAQQRLWLLDRIDTIGSAYNIAAAFALDEDLDVERFANAVRALVARHESLRTRFITRDDEPRQRVFEADTPIDFVETNDVDAALREELAHRFDLANEPLFRVLVVNKRVVLFHLHHIIADAQSADVVLEELEALYRGESLEPLRIQSKDATRWLRARDDSAHREYWLQQLAPPVATLDLPADFARPATRTFEGALVQRALPRELAQSLHELARERAVTPFVLFAAAVKALLYRYTGEEDIVVGTPVSGRPHADLERQVGLYLDTIVLRDEVRAGEPFLELLDRVHETTTAAFEHSYPFDKLVGELALPRDTSRSPLFDVLLVHHARERTTFLGATPYPLPAQTSKFDLSIHVSEDRLEFEYATDLFTQARIERLAEHLESMLRSIAEDPSQSIGELPLGVIPSRADGEESPAENILAKIDAVPAEHACLVFNDRTLTFGEVRERADRLAAQLTSIIKPGDVVAVTLDRSDELAIAMLATLKAGGVYAYLDPHLPPARFELLLNDCDPRAVINGGVVARVSNAEPLEGAAYIVYTSGSTGQPKGVVATRRCVDNLISWQERALGRGLRSLQFASLSFDVSIQEILFSLASGGTLIIPSNDERRDLTPLLARHDIELVTMPFSALNAWFLGGAERIAAVPSLKHIITSGEQLQITAEMRRFLEARPDVSLHNQYGPSETHVVTSHTISASRGNITDLPPIGTPVANTSVFIVDPRLQPVPAGIPGELLVGGANVANGYLRRDDLTRDRFIRYQGERVYRTGDRARWREDGAIEFLGRRDEQVKIRGFRVEPGEVEQTLRQHPRVRDAAVIAAGESGARELWAYVAGDIDEDDVRAHAARTLPDYMVPSRVIAMDALPLTPSGKLDRLALPRPSATISRDYVTPRSAIESQLAAIFESVLQRAPVGIHDDFFAIGGHSLSATRLVARISRELGLDAGLSDVFGHPTVASLAAHLRAASPAAAPIEAVPPADHYALSHAQQRMWVLEHLSADASAYHVPAAIRVRGPLDVARLERALQSLVDAHESFRTTFLFEDGEPRQRIAPDLRAQIHIVDSLRDEFAHRFDLAAGPLFRVALMRVAEDEAVLFVNLHHIITDGWSLDLCIRQLLHAYESDARIAAPRVTYKDYAQWQRALPETGTYWHAQLADLEPLELPTDFPRPAAQSFEGKTLTFDVDADITQRFSEMAARHGASVFIALLAAVKTLLHRASGQRDFAVGSPIAGRSHRDLEDVAGCFINTLVLRDRIDPDETFASFLARVRETTLAAYEHQSYPFDRLVDELVTARDASRSPLFDVLVAMQNDGALDVRIGGTSFREEPLPLSMAKFDLSFTAFIDAGALQLSVQYATALFEEETIRRMARHLERLLDAVAANPEVTLRDIPLVDEDERQQLMRVMHGESAPVELTSLVDLFERAADQWPDRVAVACGGESLTYRALDTRANAIAQWLIAEHGVAADARVGVRIERSVDLIAAMLGTLKAGGAYVPVETWYPEARASMILDDAQCATVITAEQVEYAITRFSSDRPRVNIAPHHLAYVLYTSGSTGKPKGVMIQHHSVVNFAAGVREMFFAHANAPLRIGLIASVVFDASVRQIYPALLNGHELHIVDDDTKRDAHALVQWLSDRRIDACDATPSVFAVMMDGGLADAAHKPRWFLLVGESFARALAERFHANGNRESVIVNSYGPTECTVESTSYPIDPDAMPPGAHLPIGRPLVNQSIWLLDEAGRLLPYGARGEICIGGLGLARGYLGREDLTAERFIAHPIIRGERLYRTGDYGRWRNDGQLEFHGRRDGQVKVRGYRIELGDVEAALRRCDGVRDAAVVVHDSDLAAYVVAENLDAIRAQLAQLLPAYMIPAWIVPIDAIPLGATGKIDRRALPPPPREEEHVAPATDLERALAGIWSEVLGVDDIGVTTSFFTIGGNSIRAIQILSRMRRDLELQAPLAEFFARPTIRELATYASLAPRTANLEPGDAISAAQRRLWIIDRMIGPTSLYNIPAALRIRGAFDVDAFKRAVDALVQRHESLRTTFIAIDGTPHLRIAPSMNCLTDDDAAQPFDLERGPLFRVTLSQVAGGDWIVLFNAHHIIADAWSSEILVRELFALYRGEELPPLQFGPRDFASLPEPEGAREWWLAQLAPPVAALDLPADHARPNVRTYTGTTAKFALDPSLAPRLASLGRAHGATLFMTLLACVKALLHRYTGEEDIVIGTPVAGRVDPRMEDVVGLFVNTLALRDRIRADARFIDVLQQVRDTTAGALERQTVPFDALIDALQLERDPSRNALTDIFVSLRRDEATRIDIPNAIVTPVELPVTTSKFDLAFHFVESNDALALEIEYSTELFERPRIERLFGHLHALIESALASPETAVGDLQLIPDDELAVILGTARCAALDAKDSPSPGASRHPLPARRGEGARWADEGHNIIDEFESIADRYADRTAVVYEDRAWTYRELDEHANRIAHALGDRAGARIALRVTRSEWLIAAMLGILESGAAYVPIDPQWPEERAQFVIRDCECAVVLDDDFVQRAASQPASRIGAAPRDPNALAYILYTSGSTGTPKGVMIEHRGIANLARAYVQFYPGDALRIACVASTAFDGSGAQIWSALLRGHTLHLIPDELRRDAASLVRALERERIDVADATPSLFAMMLEAGLCESAWRPQRITLAGEALPPALAQRFYAGANRETRLLNLYGPTECSVCATGGMIDPEDCATITIGKPIENVHVLLLDERGHLVPFGCAGEICIGGDGVARGYWKRDDLTAERFVLIGGERMYRSGDYGRWRDDGNLEFIGRRDGQLKLRGYRIEAGEIEAALLARADVEQAAVLLRANELVAWIVARNDVDPATLRGALARTLPSYMIPSRFLRVDALPLSASDKIDRKALLALEGAELRSTYVAPSTDAERDLAQAWQEVLNRNAVGVHENYFHLGGDSIRAIQIVARLAERGWKLDVRTLFRFPTIAALAPHMECGYAAAFESESDDTDAPLLPAQAWFFENPGPDPHHFNQSLLLRAHERIDFDRFERAIHQVVERHDALRKGAAVRFVDLQEMQTSLTAIAEEEQRAIDLDRGPLLRAVVFHGDDADRVLLVIHHLAVDGVSWRIVLDDVRRAYDGIPLAPRSGSVAAWARALHAWSPVAQLPFWKRIDGAPSDDPPRDRDPEHGTYANVRGVSIDLTSEATRALERINAEWHTHHGDVLLTALSLACERWYGARTLRVAVEGHGREDFGAGIDVSNTVGWFTSIFPLILELKRPDDAVYALRFQKETLRQVPNGGIGYGVLRYFRRALDPAEEPRIVVNYLGKFEPRAVGFSLADESPGAAISPRAPLRHELAITGIVAEERLRITIEYDSAKYDAATIDVFARHFEHAIAMLIAACESAHAAPTPADFTYAGGFALDELDELFREGSAS